MPDQSFMVDSIEVDEYGSIWGHHEEDIFELFYRSEGEDDSSMIQSGYREVMDKEGYPVSFNGDYLFVQAASDIEV